MLPRLTLLALLHCASAFTVSTPSSAVSAATHAAATLRTVHPLLCTVPPEGGWEAYEWWEDGVSCVEYEDEGTGELRLGVYNAYTILESEPHIRPLCAAAEDEGISCLYCDEEVPAVALSAVRRVRAPRVPMNQGLSSCCVRLRPSFVLLLCRCWIRTTPSSRSGRRAAGKVSATRTASMASRCTT